MPPRFKPFEFTAVNEAELMTAARRFHATMATRRTVRDYSDRTVPREVIETAIRTAASAPSGANQQPWHFVAVSRDNPELRRRIRQAAEEEERELYAHRAPKEWLDALDLLGTDWHKPFLEIAPWLVAVFVLPYGRRADGTTFKHYYALESVGIATGFLVAALHHAGLATLTHTPSPMKFLNELLGRLAHERPFLLLVTGYPADNARVPDIGKKPLNEIASWK